MKKIACAVLLAGCVFAPAKGPPRTPGPAPSPAATANGPRAHWLRMAWTYWESDTELYYCHRRLDDDGNPIGITGPCWKLQAGDATPHRMVAWLNAGKPETTALTIGPPGCSIELEDAQLVPARTPARLWLVSPTGRTALDEWLPDAQLVGDLFVLEPSWSPDRKQLAILRVVVGLGEAERTVEIAGASMRWAPSCR